MDLVDQIERALWGEWPETDDEDFSDAPHPLESHPEQAAIKAYLMEQGYLAFQDDIMIAMEGRRVGFRVHVLDRRDDLSWCCDPMCDRVIVGIPLMLFRDTEHGGGTIEFHIECANRLMRAGVFALSGRGDDERRTPCES